MTVAYKVTFPLTRDAARSRVTLKWNGKLLVIQWSYETQRWGRCKDFATFIYNSFSKKCHLCDKNNVNTVRRKVVLLGE